MGHERYRNARKLFSYVIRGVFNQRPIALDIRRFVFSRVVRERECAVRQCIERDLNWTKGCARSQSIDDPRCSRASRASTRPMMPLRLIACSRCLVIWSLSSSAITVLSGRQANFRSCNFTQARMACSAGPGISSPSSQRRSVRGATPSN